MIWDEQPGILVPTTAVSTLGGQNFVYLATEDNSQEESNSQSASEALIAQQQPIKLGSIQAQDYQVISGLELGDRIAVSNILSLRDGTSIKPAEEEQAVSDAETE
ncbi:Efflux transporter, RND family, MFP subunit (fragment) [Hyella patelloides LEGE 07179]|uniref:Efflux transporter, RND family, MFP subunit n=1 Tax=Hyella patelloides LEGE 07179 TaxID=945734 RepID=A0A563VWA1_9CYAN